MPLNFCHLRVEIVSSVEFILFSTSSKIDFESSESLFPKSWIEFRNSVIVESPMKFEKTVKLSDHKYKVT